MSVANRRRVLHALGAAPLMLAGCASIRGRPGSRRIVVIGAGYGGATAARYSAMWRVDAFGSRAVRSLLTID
jgi:sulfide dehydrogenase [flavocytochrome c] flavoprotein subunit